MKTITINLPEPVYNEFKAYAKRTDRKTSELIREAMERYRDMQFLSTTSICDLPPLNVGKVLAPLTREDDLLEDMLSD